MIKALLYKDFINILDSMEKKYYFLIFFVIDILIFYFAEAPIAAIFSGIFAFTIFASTFSMDEQAVCTSYVVATPTSKKHIAEYKFLLFFILEGIIMAINVVVFYVFKIFGVIENIGVVEMVIAPQMGMFIFYILIIPATFKYGIVKAPMVIVGILILSYLILYAINGIDKIKILLSNFKESILILIVIAFMCVIVIISYLTTLIILNNKDY